jgi:hypothetical protein
VQLRSIALTQELAILQERFERRIREVQDDGREREALERRIREDHPPRSEEAR